MTAKLTAASLKVIREEYQIFKRLVRIKRNPSQVPPSKQDVYRKFHRFLERLVKERPDLEGKDYRKYRRLYGRTAVDLMKRAEKMIAKGDAPKAKAKAKAN